MKAVKMNANVVSLKSKLAKREWVEGEVTTDINTVLSVLHAARGQYLDRHDDQIKAIRCIAIYTRGKRQWVVPFYEGRGFCINPFQVKVIDGEPRVELDRWSVGGMVDNRGSNADGYNAEEQLRDGDNGHLGAIYRIVIGL